MQIRRCRVRGFKVGVVYQFSLESATNEQFTRSTCCIRVFCYNATRLCSSVTPTSHRASFNKTLFESKRFQAIFLVLQTKTRGRRTSQGVVDTMTVHCQSSRNLSCFCLPVVQIKLPEQNFRPAQPCVDSFVIAVCCCLSFCCRRRSCHTFQTTRVPGYERHV